VLRLDWLRLVIIIGGYLLLRPVLARYGANLQEKHYEKEGSKRVSRDSLASEKKRDKQDREDLQWGAGARRRQRKAAEFHPLQEDDSSDELKSLER
jgi:Protein trafficking PGA2